LDLALYFRVFWRFRLLIATGLLLAVCLATLSFARIDFKGTPKLTYRQHEQWQSTTTLLVQPPGFTWGEVTSSDISIVNAYGSLAQLYAKLATSDQVTRIVRSQGSVARGKVDGTYVSQSPSDPNGAPLPMVAISATTASPSSAAALARRQALAFMQYLSFEQARNAIPVEKRVRVSLVQREQPPLLLKGRSKTLPIVVFLTVMLAVVGLAFMLENLRPRVHAAEAEDLTARQHRLSA
jgi:hypothetical protein